MSSRFASRSSCAARSSTPSGSSPRGWATGGRSRATRSSRSRRSAVVLDGRVGGRVYEVIERRGGLWGTLTAWDPPHRFAMTWHPGRDEKTAQDLELRFSPQGDATRVDLVAHGLGASRRPDGRDRMATTTRVGISSSACTPRRPERRLTCTPTRHSRSRPSGRPTYSARPTGAARSRRVRERRPAAMASGALRPTRGGRPPVRQRARARSRRARGTPSGPRRPGAARA